MARNNPQMCTTPQPLSILIYQRAQPNMPRVGLEGPTTSLSNTTCGTAQKGRPSWLLMKISQWCSHTPLLIVSNPPIGDKPWSAGCLSEREGGQEHMPEQINMSSQIPVVPRLGKHSPLHSKETVLSSPAAQ